MTSMRSKIFGSIVATLLFGIFLCAFLFYIARSGSVEVQEITNKTFEVIRQSEALRQNFKAMDELTERVFSMSSFITREEISVQFEMTNSALAKAGKVLLEQSLSNKMHEKAFEFNKQKLIWLKDTRLLLGLEQSDHIPIIDVYKIRQAKIEKTVNALVKLAKDEATRNLLQTEKDLNDTLLNTFGLALIAATFFTFMGFFLARGLSRPLLSLVYSAKELAAGNTEVKFTQSQRKDEIGEVVRAVAGFRDGVIDRLALQENLKLQTKELRDALSKEQELNELQRQFVSMVSHEFRTPLAIIDSSARRLDKRKNKATSDDIDKRTTKIKNAVHRMLNLIEDTLLVAKVDDGKLSITPEAMNLQALIELCCENQNDIATNHYISCNLEALPQNFIGDKGALTQVMTNLLSNAVKYSPDCFAIEVDGWVEGGDVFISVRDYGLGMDEEDVSQLFNRFFRAKTSTGIPGTGIGLNLVSTLIELHDGEVSVRSKQGEGSTFTLKLPMKSGTRETLDLAS